MKVGVFFIIGFAVLAGCSDAPDKPQAVQSPGEPPAPVAVPRVSETTPVIAYYFHGTVRCETCLRIEKQAQELISGRFAAEVASELLVFKSVNYDQPENAHFSKDYGLPCPSLVLVRQKEGKHQEWKLLGQTWDFVQVPAKLDHYIEEETRKFLEAANRESL